MANKIRLTELTLKYAAKEITPEELEELNAYLDAAHGRRKHFEDRIREENVLEGILIMKDAAELREEGRAFFGWTSDHTIRQSLPPAHHGARRWLWAAAAVVLLIASAAVLFTHKHQVSGPIVKNTPVLENDRPPGGNRAVLTLDNGQQVVLDSATKGILARQENSLVEKTADGQVTYAAAGNSVAIRLNTLTTPAGGQYQVVLADGTKVWLNNASSLRFPSAFTGPRREVQLTGEAYFEVARDTAHPFIVHKDAMSVRVLGTHFNIRAYNDESVQSTTLLEGSVEVTEGSHSAMLHPGEQAAVRPRGPVKVIDKVDVDAVISWKNGYFHFEGEDLPEVMIQLARWYDVSVEYRGNFRPHQFQGKIERNLPLSVVLQGLESTDVHFKIEGSKIIVTP